MAQVQKDLFGKKVKARKEKLATVLMTTDRKNFATRLERLKYLDNFCYANGIAGDIEIVLIFGEARLAFLNGAFLATILLAQAFIEHWLEGNVLTKRRQIANLKEVLKLCIDEGLLSQYLVNKIDNLRKVRNTITHPKPFSDSNTLNQRLFKAVTDSDFPIERTTTTAVISDILEKDAKNALEIMFTLHSMQPFTLK